MILKIINTHVRYVTLDKEQKQVFRLGGLLKKIHSKYVQPTNGTYTWSVQRYHYKNDTDEEPVFETVFFSVIPRKFLDIIKQQDQKLKHLRQI